MRLIELGTNYGRGFARDRGVADACEEYAGSIDADIILPPDWLIQTRAAIGKGFAVCGPPVPDGDVAYIKGKFQLTPRFISRMSAVTGNNGLHRREVFELVRFDTTLWEGEDVALNYAMKQADLPIATVPALVVEHWRGKSFGTSLRWLFDSDVGTTWQLLAYHAIRQPDCVAGGFVVGTAVGAFHAVRDHWLGSDLPLRFVQAVGVQHVRSHFEMPLTDWHRLAPVMAADSALLTVYLLGRLAGLSRLRRRGYSRRNQEVAPAL